MSEWKEGIKKIDEMLAIGWKKMQRDATRNVYVAAGLLTFNSAGAAYEATNNVELLKHHCQPAASDLLSTALFAAGTAISFFLLKATIRREEQVIKKAEEWKLSRDSENKTSEQ